MSQQHHQVINSNGIGYVSKCACCQEVQFGIGTVVSHMPEQGFRNLVKSLQQIAPDADQKLVSLPDGDRLLLRTPVEDMWLSLSRKEFDDLLELFTQTVLILDANNLINEASLS